MFFCCLLQNSREGIKVRSHQYRPITAAVNAAVTAPQGVRLPREMMSFPPRVSYSFLFMRWENLYPTYRKMAFSEENMEVMLALFCIYEGQKNGEGVGGYTRFCHLIRCSVSISACLRINSKMYWVSPRRTSRKPTLIIERQSLAGKCLLSVWGKSSVQRQYQYVYLEPCNII